MESTVWLVLAWSATLGFIISYVAQKVPELVMDEVFHVPQTQQFCRGNWRTWDQKITTLPGMYIIGTVYGRLMLAVGLEGCSTWMLRSVNGVLGVAVLAVTHSALRQQWPQSRSCDSAAMALSMGMLPTHFFFQFLYYTDVAGVLGVVLAYERSLRRQWGLSAAAAAAAVLCRQTNVVWVAFVCGAALLRESALQNTPGERQGSAAEVLAWMFQERRRVSAIAAGYVAVAAAFAVFVVANGGIVVGDRDAHRPAQHAAQLPYLCLFAVGAFLPTCLADCALLADARRSWLSVAGDVVMYTAVAAAAVRHGTVAHPYLLADNRHYTFYIWKNLLGRSAAVRTALAPAYAACAYELSARLTRSGGALLTAGFWACAVAALLPAGLVEFRYFTVPTLLFVAQLKPPHWRVSAAQVICFAGVNAGTLYMLCERPFFWPDGSVARFMW